MCLDVLPVDHEDGEVVVTGEIGARRLHDVEVGEASRRRPGGLLPDLEAAVGALRAGGDRVPEVGTGLGVGIREGTDLAGVERPDVLVDQLGGGAEHDRVHRTDVHHVAHRGGGATVAGNRLAHHRVGDVILTQTAVLLRHREPKEPVLAEELQVAAGEHELVVEALGVHAKLLLAELDQGGAKLLLPVGVDPVRIPVVAESPEGLGTPHLLGHLSSMAAVSIGCPSWAYRRPC